MSNSKTLVGILRGLAQLVEEEAEKSPDFAARLDAVLAPVRSRSQLTIREGKVRPRISNIPDVLTALEEKGEDEFKFWLRNYDISVLKSIIKANGFDVSRTSQKWKDPDKLQKLILEQASARLRRGSGFLPVSQNDKP